MVSSELGTNAVFDWAPDFPAKLDSLAYLGFFDPDGWRENFWWAHQLDCLIRADGHAIAAEIWRRVLREKEIVPAPVLLVILEHLRKNPGGAALALDLWGSSYSRALANVSYRVADALYEAAKDSFSGDEIDVAMARFKYAISEFRFAIESELLSDSTRRQATGKYASAIAMLGRWSEVSGDALLRALSFSKESMALGNLSPETLVYRMELLVLQFDRTGERKFLEEGLQLLSINEDISSAAGLVDAEVRFRLARMAEEGSREARRYVLRARERVVNFYAKSGYEEARRVALLGLVSEGRVDSVNIPARSLSVPRGILLRMAVEPSAQLWATVRLLILDLEVLRRERRWVPAAVLSARFLRRMVDGPPELLDPKDLSLYVEVTQWLSEKVPTNRYFQWESGAAALSAAKRTGNLELARRAEGMFEALANNYKEWPLPQIGIARVQDYLSSTPHPPSAANSLLASNWGVAASLALKSLSYARSQLGGRNEVFAVSDARGFLSETFVFKRTTKVKAEYEASMLEALGKEIRRLGEESRFDVPRSLAIVEIDAGEGRRWVHVSQRAAGRLVSELATDEAERSLYPIVDLLAIFHRVAGRAEPGRSAWRSLKDHVRMWARTLLPRDQLDLFVSALHDVFPAELPLVRKRDGHASNWLIDPVGRVVAIDLESSEFLPVGYDVAQLIEDHALIPADSAGWVRRVSVFKRYLEALNVELSDEDVAASYAWFATTRALRLGTERDAGKQLRRHARELCGLIVQYGGNSIRAVAQELLNALSRVEQSDSGASVPSHDHRRLSKSMAYELRHNKSPSAVVIDRSGFAGLEDLAAVLRADVSQLLAVAEHPGEPRFEIRDGNIRALYGHSIDVRVEVGFDVGGPAALFHGSSWGALDNIVNQGLRPMSRRMVHLANTASEAMAVGERKGAPIVFSVRQSGKEEAVAEGIWVVQEVGSNDLSILNPYVDEAGVMK